MFHLSIKRIAGQQTLHPNYNVDNPKEYYKLSLTIPLLERVTGELETRFSKENRIHSDGFFILPTTVVETDDWKTTVRGFAKGYKQDLPEPMNLEAEMEQWAVDWKRSFESDQNIPDTIVTTLKSVNPVKTSFPNIYRILCLIAFVPASSNSCENSISCLRLLKTYLCSTVNKDRLILLAHIFTFIAKSISTQKKLWMNLLKTTNTE